MARRKKNMTLDETIESTKANIAMYEENLKAARADLKELLKQKKEEELQELHALIKESGKTISEIKNLIVNKDTEASAEEDADYQEEH